MNHTIEIAKKNAERNGTKFEIVDDMDEAFKDADIVYPKSMGHRRVVWKARRSAQACQELQTLDLRRAPHEAHQTALDLHALLATADRGNEVTDEVIDGPHSVIYQEAENRLHTCKSIMTLTMS